MGKKSLFQPMSDAASDADQKAPKGENENGDEKQPDIEKEKAAAAPQEDTAPVKTSTEAGKVEETPAEPPEETPAEAANEAEKSEETPALTESSAEAAAPEQATSAAPKASETPAPQAAVTSPQKTNPAMGSATPPPPPPEDNRRFDSGSGDEGMKRFIGIAAACLGFVILLVIIASAMNSGRYYIKETKGAVKILKGNFTPVGKDRVTILHGTHWEGEKKDAYTKAEVYDFAARFYIERALLILNETGMQDLSQIYDYLEEAREISAAYDNRQQVDTLAQVNKYLDQAAVLYASGEEAAQQIKEKRLAAAKHALTGLLVEEETAAEEGAADKQEASPAEEAGQAHEETAAGH
ncbi:MAG: hypothetical protein SWH68_01635 [Thermodesulfobacteriota bacterium]|nr:hypothetical protein [Thermodesulfobacteriota bacterium]